MAWAGGKLDEWRRVATSSSMASLAAGHRYAQREGPQTANSDFCCSIVATRSSSPFRWQHRRLADPRRGYGLGATVATALLGIGTPDAPGLDFPNTETQHGRSAAQAYGLDSRDPMFDSPMRWLDRAIQNGSTALFPCGGAARRLQGLLFKVHLSEI